MAPGLPSIVKLASRLQLEVNAAVARFTRAHRYTVGAELRTSIFEVVFIAHEAWRERGQRAAHLAALSREIDRFKLRLQLAQDLGVCSFAQMQMLIRLAVQLGRQCGGWQREQSRARQNAPAPQASAQRPPILSTRAASQEVSA